VLTEKKTLALTSSQVASRQPCTRWRRSWARSSSGTWSWSAPSTVLYCRSSNNAGAALMLIALLGEVLMGVKADWKALEAVALSI